MANEVITIENLQEFKTKYDVKVNGIAEDVLDEVEDREEADTALGQRIDGKQDKLTAGTNITISDDNVISATGGSGGKTYSGVAPVVVDNTNDQISVNNKELFVQRPLNIAYDENENPVIQAETADVNYQQIVHDDSLVHVSNNAQYALGVNTNMFKDETVLWEGEQTNSVTLSEDPMNFEYIEIWANARGDNDLHCTTVKLLDYGNVHIIICAGNNYMQFGITKATITSNSLTTVSSLATNMSWTTSTLAVLNNNANHLNCIGKVVGIGRKGGN